MGVVREERTEAADGRDRDCLGAGVLGMVEGGGSVEVGGGGGGCDGATFGLNGGEGGL